MLCWCYFTCLGTEEQGRQKREEKEQQQSPENKTKNKGGSQKIKMEI